MNPPDEPLRPLLNLGRVAAVLGVSLRQVHRLVADGRLAVVKVSSRCVRVQESELNRFLKDAGKA